MGIYSSYSLIHLLYLYVIKIQPDILWFSREDEIYPQPDNTF